MARDKDFVRVRTPDKERIRVGKVGNLEDKAVRKQMPVQYLDALASNEKLKPCCRDTSSNYTYETFKTEAEFEAPNMAVFTCTVCGCKHYRGAVGPGKI